MIHATEEFESIGILYILDGISEVGTPGLTLQDQGLDSGIYELSLDE